MPEGQTPQVSLAYVHTNDLTVSFHESLMALVAFDGAGPQFLVHDAGRMAMRCGTDGLVAARNEVVSAFLATDSEWLFWIDTDMGFSADTLLNLMAVADQAERPVISALCFASREVGADGMGGFRTYPRPTIFDWTDLGDGFMRFAGRTIYRPASVVQCNATGSACILVHRSVFEKIGTSGWYDRLVGTDGMLLGEDISFCARVGAAGFPIYVHTGVRTTHRKPRWVAEPDFWAQYLPPPATERVEILVPVSGPDGAATFMASLRASTGLARVTVLADAGDEAAAEAWAAAGADEVDRLSEDTVARKVDWAIRHPLAEEPWLLVTGPDVRFYPGWLDHAQHMAITFDAAVVGTNDLTTPASLAGEWSGNLLMRRLHAAALAKSHGARWYEPDRVIDEAKRDGVWVMAPGALVERLDASQSVPVGEIVALRPFHEDGRAAELAVLVPTRGRPEAAAELVEAFASTSTAVTGLLFVIDVDDPQRAEYEAVVDAAQEADRAVALCVVGYGDARGNMVAALNAAARWLTRPSNPNPSSAIAFLGDDHRPLTQGWDWAYVAALREPGVGVVYGDDLLQGEALPTQVAMTADIVRDLGYMAPPTLRHMYVDNWWKTLGEAAGCLRYLPGVTVEHLHPIAGKAEWDEGHKRVNAREVFVADEAAYRRWCAEHLAAAAGRVRALAGAQ